MKLSPPILVLAFLAVVLAGVGLLKEPAPPRTHVTVNLPVATYDKVVLWAKGRTDNTGQALTVPVAIETLADRQP